MWKLASPDQNNQIIVTPRDNEIILQVIRNYHILCNIQFSLQLEKRKLIFLDGISSDPAHREETYCLPWGKMASYHTHGNAMTVTFRNWKLHLRADLQGIAFRFELTGSGTEEIIQENTTLSFSPEFETLFAQDLFPTYERPYEQRTWEQTEQQRLGMPALLRGHHVWVLASEADLLSRGTYCSCHWIGRRNRTLSLAFAPEEKGASIPVQLPFLSPWRYLTIADEMNDLIRSHFNFDLCAPSRIHDLSWIRPARALWAWWEYENGAQLYSESRHYVDTAAEMGFEAVTLDCGWDANWVPQLCQYAHEKSVQLWLWTDRHRIDTREKMEQFLPLWASWGIDGLKIDFFENDSLATIKIYQMLLERTAELRLMVNFHGATKPSGDGRTWPHLMTSEGIMGIEHYKWSDMPNAVHNCTVPFTRNVCGPMDYTPVGYSNTNRNTTHAHQLALSVVFESGVMHYALSVYHLEGWAGTGFLRRTKAAYDDVQLLLGSPGKDVAIMRRSGNEYFIGALTVEKQQLLLSLRFLPPGNFEAEIYEDDEKDQMLSVHKMEVFRDMELRLSLHPNGGAAIYIAPKVERLSNHSKLIKCWNASECQMRRGSEPMHFADGQSGVLLYGAISFDCAVSQTKEYTLRFWYTSISDAPLAVRMNGQVFNYALPSGNSHFDMRTWDIPLALNDMENRMEIERMGQEVPAIANIALLDIHTPHWTIYGKESASMSGNAEWIQKDNNEWAAVGLGMDASITFHRIKVHHTGTYLLRIRYSGGESKQLSILINNEEPIDTYLHSTSGWGFPTWNNIEYKEYLIHLQSGENEICLFSRSGKMSHIYSIGISASE